MTNNTELIVDNNGFEILVSYDYEEEKARYEEQGNVASFVAESVYTELRSVEVIIAGTGIDILPMMNKRQHNQIIEKLTYKD